MLVFILQLNLDSVWLREAGPGRVGASFFPDSRNERFDFSADVGFFITRLTVEGVSTSSSRPSDGSSSRVLTAATTRASSTAILPAGNSKKGRINVKVVQATMKRSSSGRLEFMPISQTFIDVTESTANVNYLSHAIKMKWGDEYELVTSDGIRIEDSSGTHGIYYA